MKLNKRLFCKINSIKLNYGIYLESLGGRKKTK